MTIRPIRPLDCLLAAGAFLLLSIAYTAARAAPNQPVERLARVEGVQAVTSSTEYRTNLDGGETFTALGNTYRRVIAGDGGVEDVPSVTCGGFFNASVSGDFSVASATVVVHVHRYAQGTDGALTYISSSQGTLTAHATQTVDGTDYRSTLGVEVTTNGANVLKVTADDPSSGSVDLWVEVY